MGMGWTSEIETKKLFFPTKTIQKNGKAKMAVRFVHYLRLNHQRFGEVVFTITRRKGSQTISDGRCKRWIPRHELADELTSWLGVERSTELMATIENL